MHKLNQLITHRLPIFLFSFTTILIVLLAFNPVDAKALTVSPVRIELTGDPGKTIVRTIKLLNEQPETKTFYVSYENFTAKEESGKPEFIGAKDGLATWMSAPAQVTLQPQEERKIQITINVPANADPGSHYAAIFWGTSPPQVEEGGQVAIGGRLGILVLLTISGDIQESGTLVEFSTIEGQKFFTMLPVGFFYRFQNSGNVSLKPTGQIEVKNLFGQTAATLTANAELGNVLAKTTRRFENAWSSDDKDKSSEVGFADAVKKQASDLKFGRYQANLNLTYGSDQTVVSKSAVFWIIPWQLLSVVALVLVFGFVLVRYLLKRYTQKAIQKAMEERRSRS